MAFPLDIRTELQLGGTWSDVSPDVYVRDVKQITRGLRDQGATADPSTLALTLNNLNGKYSPRNAMSPLFGLIGRNTPVRVSVPADGDNYLQLDGRSGNFASTPDTAALDITGDLDVRAEISPDWYGASNQLVIGKWDRANLQQSWVLQIAGRYVWLRYSTAGNADVGGRYFGRPLPQLPDRAAIRATLDIDNGAGGNTVTFYWAESLDAPDGWTQIGTPSVLTAGTDPIYSGSAPLSIGITDLRDGVAEPRYPLNGRGYRFEVRNGIDGPVVASPDFRNVAAGSRTFTDSSARTWTLSGAAEVRDREDRFVGEVSSWPRKWSTDDADQWTPIQASGIMRRLGQGAKAIDSTLRRRIPSGNPVAYWPMEEQAEAVQAYSPIPGVLPASVSGVEWASADSLPSSASLPVLTDSSGLSATVPAFKGGQWQVEFVYNAADIVPTANAQVIAIHSNDGVIAKWTVEMRQALATVSGYLANGTRVIWQGITIGADVFHGWTRLRFWAQDDADGAGFTWRINWQDVGGDAGGLSGTYATGTCGSVSLLSGDWSAEMEGWSFGHLFVLPTANNTLIDGSDDAYLGETAWERMARLAGEEGFTFTRTPGALAPELVGYQRQDTLLNLVEAAADAEGGLLTEDINRIGLHYRDRSSLYTQTPLFELAYDAPGLGPDIEPVDDDDATVNDVTVTRDGGSSGRAVLESGPLSVNPAPDGIGKYDASYTLSLANDDQPEPHAYWRLHLGTWDGSRYPTVSIMLHKPGAEWLIPYVLRMREGDKIRLTNLPEWVSHDDVDLIVLGWSETLDLYRWELTLNCVPAGPYDTAVVEHPIYGTVDTDGSALEVAATATDAKLYVRTTSGPQWTEDAADMPCFVRASGELIQVNSITKAGADKFERTVSNGWGTADSGQAWFSVTSAPAADYAVNAGVGKHVFNAKGAFHATSLNVGVKDCETLTRVSVPVIPTGDHFYTYHAVRSDQAVANFYFARLAFRTDSKIELSVRKRVPSEILITQTTSANYPAYTAGSSWWVRLRVSGSALYAKLWKDGTTEPTAWTLTATDTAITAGTYVGCRSLVQAANTNTLPVALSFDEFSVTDVQAFNVVRSLNGVSKPQTKGTALQISEPPITSL